MARLESVLAMGYFPTPSRVVAAVARHLAAPSHGARRAVRVLDPCAGEGHFAREVAAALGGESFGIELHTGRAAAARAHLDRVVDCDAFAIRLTNGAFSCLLLNPPYDDDGEKRRTEHAFLTGLGRALGPGGVLVFIVPQRRLALSARFLASHYADLAVYRFPDPEFAAFGQVVLFGVRKGQAALDPGALARLEAWGEADLPPLPDAPDPAAPRWALPALPAGPVTFSALIFDPAGAVAEAERRGVWASAPLAEELWPAEAARTRPLMPLKRGHTAQLIAAGLLDNQLLRRGEERVLVKGRVRKVLVAVSGEDEDADTLVEIERLRTTITVLRLDNGAIAAIGEDATAAAAERDERQAA